jgi:hypothetical protein
LRILLNSLEKVIQKTRFLTKYLKGEFKRGFAPLYKIILPLSFEGEGDTGGEVEK